jgi:hypothetical protein
MSLYLSDTRVLDESLQESLADSVSELKTRIERTLLRPVTPNAETKFALKKFRKERELLGLAIVSWYLDDVGILLREDLRTKSFSHSLEFQENLAVICHSKEEMLLWLSTYSFRIFYGTWLPLIRSLPAKLVFLSLQPKRAKQLVRRRGYQDKGSCRPQSRWLPTFDWTFTELHLQLEIRKDLRDKTLSSIEKYGILGVRLPQFE